MIRPQIPNWTTDAEAAELARLAAGKTVLEVGTYRGFGAVLMARAGATVWAVDWHRGDQDLGEQDTLCSWWTNVRRAQVEDRVIGLVGRSEVVLPMLKSGTFDLAFIDASHRYEDVLRDARLSLPLLRVGGRVAFHDYSSVWPDVIRAVDDFRGGLPVAVIDSLAVVHLDPRLSLT